MLNTRVSTIIMFAPTSAVGTPVEIEQKGIIYFFFLGGATIVLQRAPLALRFRSQYKSIPYQMMAENERRICNHQADEHQKNNYFGLRGPEKGCMS